MVGRSELMRRHGASIAPLLPVSGRRGGQRRDYRTVINGILWKLRTGGVVWEISVDSSIACAHQHASGARHRPRQADAKRESNTRSTKGSDAAAEG